MAAAHSPLSIYIIHILCINASESAGKKHEEGRKERWIWKLPFLGDGGKLRERERDRKEERDDVYIYTPLGTELSSTRTMSSGCLLETFQTKRRQSRNLG